MPDLLVGKKLRVAYTFISMPVGGAEDFAAVVSRYLPELSSLFSSV